MHGLRRTDGASLEYEHRRSFDQSSAATFIFQHGMGGDRQQPLGYLRSALQGIDVVSMDARGHGGSSDIADPSQCGFDRVRRRRRCAGRRPADGTVHHRWNIARRGRRTQRGDPSPRSGLGAAAVPAGMAGCAANRPQPRRLRTDRRPARQARRGRGARHVRGTTMHQEVLAESPSAAQSLRHQITRPRAAINADILRRFPASTPAPDPSSGTTSPSPPWSSVTETTHSIPGTSPRPPRRASRINAGRNRQQGPRAQQFAVAVDAALRPFSTRTDRNDPDSDAASHRGHRTRLVQRKSGRC